MATLRKIIQVDFNSFVYVIRKENPSSEGPMKFPKFIIVCFSYKGKFPCRLLCNEKLVLQQSRTWYNLPQTLTACPIIYNLLISYIKY